MGFEPEANKTGEKMLSIRMTRVGSKKKPFSA